MTDRITSSYLHNLQAIYHRIDNRGIVINPSRLEEARIFVDTDINRNLAIASAQWGCHVFVGADNALTDKNNSAYKEQVNLNATQGEKALLRKLQNLGYKVPKITKKNEDGEYEQRYSTAELALQKMLVTNQFNFPGGDPAIRAILAVRELTKLRSSYLNCRLYRSCDGQVYYLTNYNVAGTLTGRRSSRKHTFGFGNNAQNFPKHGRTAEIFRRCLVARPGNILLSVDQKSAEEWPVSALARNMDAITQLQRGINRHIKRGSFIFSIPETSRSEKEWKDSMEYYLGKKTGHANNYGMKAQRMSDSLAQEGYSIAVVMCEQMLAKLNMLEPQTKGVFHKYVQDTINKTRVLKTPFGRERQFLGMRPNDSNYKLFNEAYAYIPQSVVGDNTGFAVSFLESNIDHQERAVIQESHDSIVQDILRRADKIWKYLQLTIQSFVRTVQFDNGIRIEIPIEAELGYDFNKMIKIKDLSYDGVVEALAKINLIHEEELENEAMQRRHASVQDLAASISI